MTLTRREFHKASLGVATTLAIGGNAVAGPHDLIHKPIPSTGEMIPVIGLGTNRYGVDTSAAARAPLKAALKRFAELGGTVIDTAPGYRTSETVLGDLIEDLGIRDDLYIATKVDRETRTDSEARIEDSFGKLKVDMIDLLQVHNLRGWQETLPLMRELKQEGRIRYVGVTTSRAEQYGDLEKIMRAEELDFVQLNYSVEQRESANRLMPLAADTGTAVMINRAFGGGRIFRAVGDQPLPGWAKEIDCSSWAQLLLKFAISHPAATLAIPGMTKAQHVEDNLMAGHGRLPDAAERKKIEDFYRSL